MKQSEPVVPHKEYIDYVSNWYLKACGKNPENLDEWTSPWYNATAFKQAYAEGCEGNATLMLN